MLTPEVALQRPDDGEPVPADARLEYRREQEEHARGMGQAEREHPVRRVAATHEQRAPEVPGRRPQQEQALVRREPAVQDRQPDEHVQRGVQAQDDVRPALVDDAPKRAPGHDLR